MSDEVYSLPTDNAGTAVKGGSIMVMEAGRIIICFLEKAHFISDGVGRQKARKQLLTSP